MIETQSNRLIKEFSSLLPRKQSELLQPHLAGMQNIEAVNFWDLPYHNFTDFFIKYNTDLIRTIKDHPLGAFGVKLFLLTIGLPGTLKTRFRKTVVEPAQNLVLQGSGTSNLVIVSADNTITNMVNSKQVKVPLNSLDQSKFATRYDSKLLFYLAFNGPCAIYGEGLGGASQITSGIWSIRKEYGEQVIDNFDAVLSEVDENGVGLIRQTVIWPRIGYILGPYGFKWIYYRQALQNVGDDLSAGNALNEIMGLEPFINPEHMRRSQIGAKFETVRSAQIAAYDIHSRTSRDFNEMLLGVRFDLLEMCEEVAQEMGKSPEEIFMELYHQRNIAVLLANILGIKRDEKSMLRAANPEHAAVFMLNDRHRIKDRSAFQKIVSDIDAGSPEQNYLHHEFQNLIDHRGRIIR